MIFYKKDLLWSEIFPRLLDRIKSKEREIVGTFPIPGNYEGTKNFSSIKYDMESIYFPEYGEYYLSTNLGNIKVLLLEQTSKEIDNILAVASFVYKNSVHSSNDIKYLYYEYEKGTYHTPHKLMENLFYSDQPLKLQCGDMARIMSHVYNKFNIGGNRIIQLLARRFLDWSSCYGS